MFSGKVPLFKHERTTRERVEKFISCREFSDTNLYSKLYKHRLPITSLVGWTVPHSSYSTSNQNRVEQILNSGWIDFEAAKKKLASDGKIYSPPGEIILQPTWSTHWIKIECNLPNEWVDLPVRLLWNSGCEVQVWSQDGETLQGLNGCDRTYFDWTSKLTPSSRHVELYLEVACNDMFGAGEGGMINPPNLTKQFRVTEAAFGVPNMAAFEVYWDLDVLTGIVSHLPDERHERAEALMLGNHIVNRLCMTEFSLHELIECHAMAMKFFSSGSQVCHKKGNDQGDVAGYLGVVSKPRHPQFTLHAIGNCHIDSAWLWRYCETMRKCCRSWSSSLRLMQTSEVGKRLLNFSCSQMQQLDWIRIRYPELFSRICKEVSNGSFEIVGGAWVEMDGNLPSGESFVRQLLFGQQFCRKHFGGKTSDIFWLPDTFGYSPQLPQIMNGAGMTRFMTQKLSWSLVNKFPHNTFRWFGLDGSEVLTHFPPCDTYNSTLTMQEIVKSTDSFRDKGRSHHGMVLYGHGDGGGGPDEFMLQRLDRLCNGLPGLPKVVGSTAKQFFDEIEQERDNLCSWHGELYLELHNGTYTTHAQVKQRNRRLEFALRDCELLSVVKEAGFGKLMPHFEEEWKLVLLNQFHDVLPGSSIGAVYTDAHGLYDSVEAVCQRYIDTCLIETQGNDEHGMPGAKKSKEQLLSVYFNSLGWDRWVWNDGSWCESGAMSLTPVGDAREVQFSKPKLHFSNDGTLINLSNAFITATIDRQGRVVSLRSTSDAANHQVNFITPGCHGNQFVLYDDVPLYWEAWDVMDYHLETGVELGGGITSGKFKTFEDDDGSVGIWVEMTIGTGDSRLKQQIILSPNIPYLTFRTHVHWAECRKLMKVQFAFNIHTNEAIYETQFGHIARSTHRNTSWDWAKFEVCGHKWVALQEFGRGVALLNDSKYGFSCDGSTLSMSLLRAPKAPDANADIGEHSFSYALMPYFGTYQCPNGAFIDDAGGDKVLPNVIQAAYEFNIPLRWLEVGNGLFRKLGQKEPWVSVSGRQVVIETVKPLLEMDDMVIAQDRTQRGTYKFLVRLYESFGGCCVVELSSTWKIMGGHLCNLIEEPIKNGKLNIQDGKVVLEFGAFKIVSVILEVGIV